MGSILVNSNDSIDDTKTEENLGIVEEEVKKHKFRRNCGNKLPIESKFCDKCGSKTNY